MVVLEAAITTGLLLLVGTNAVMAIVPSLVSSQSNRGILLGALTIAVCGNYKQTLTIVLGVCPPERRSRPYMGLEFYWRDAAQYTIRKSNLTGNPG